MADISDSPPMLASHVEETVKSVARLQADHHEKATRLERSIDRTTAAIGRPGFIVALTFAVLGWIGANLFVVARGGGAIDPPPFAWLTTAIAVVSLYLVVLILATQRREDQLARRRELLILELAILSEQKTAKVIELLEEVRRDNPLIHNRVDPEADVMSRPADPKSVMHVIEKTHTKTEQTKPPGDPA
jgi:uncharacterized membrane protein